jgi:hypothetical protein
MITLELTHFDQNAILFLVVSALALIRERRVLPFIVVAVGAVFQGPLVLSFLAALIAWHRMDCSASRWVQLKDLLGLFFLIGASLSTDIPQAFFLLLGTLLISINAGEGLLGTLPAIILLRQIHPNPEFAEVGLAFAALYWVVSESLRFLKSNHETKILAVLEFICGAAVLVNLRPEAEKVFSEPALMGIGSLLFLVVLTLLFWTRVRVEGFWSFQLAGRSGLARILQGGGSVLNRQTRLALDEPLEQNVDFAGALDRLLYWIFGIVLFAAIFILLTKGGLLNDL